MQFIYCFIWFHFFTCFDFVVVLIFIYRILMTLIFESFCILIQCSIYSNVVVVSCSWFGLSSRVIQFHYEFNLAVNSTINIHLKLWLEIFFYKKNFLFSNFRPYHNDSVNFRTGSYLGNRPQVDSVDTADKETKWYKR